MGHHYFALHTPSEPSLLSRCTPPAHNTFYISNFFLSQSEKNTVSFDYLVRTLRFLQSKPNNNLSKLKLLCASEQVRINHVSREDILAGDPISRYEFRIEGEELFASFAHISIKRS